MKKFHNFSKRFGLSISIENYSVNYLDVNLNLVTGLYNPFHKHNSGLKYINLYSNRLKAFRRNLVDSIWKRLSDLSSNEETLIIMLNTIMHLRTQNTRIVYYFVIRLGTILNLIMETD